MRTTVSKVAIVLAAIAALLLPASSASAAEYEYWSYFHGQDRTWSMAMEGATFIPADGTVEGWRYVKTSGEEMAPMPRVAPDFEALCSETDSVAGKKRVGLVIDFGTVTDADQRDTVATCVLVDESADGFEVLSSASTITSTSGMVSCIQGVPSGTCEAVPDVTTQTTQDSATSTSGVSPGPLLLFAVMLLSGLAFLIRSRRRR
jgi:hypothetical protein